MKQKFSDTPLTVHEGCGGVVERLLSAPALQFKGTGWYVTDYGRGKSPSSNGSKEGSEAKPAAVKTETKSESAPAAAKSSTEK